MDVPYFSPILSALLVDGRPTPLFISFYSPKGTHSNIDNRRFSEPRALPQRVARKPRCGEAHRRLATFPNVRRPFGLWRRTSSPRSGQWAPFGKAANLTCRIACRQPRRPLRAELPSVQMGHRACCGVPFSVTDGRGRLRLRIIDAAAGAVTGARSRRAFLFERTDVNRRRRSCSPRSTATDAFRKKPRHSVLQLASGARSSSDAPLGKCDMSPAVCVTRPCGSEPSLHHQLCHHNGNSRRRAVPGAARLVNMSRHVRPRCAALSHLAHLTRPLRAASSSL